MAAQGIGGATALLFARQGTVLAAGARKPEKLAKVTGTLREIEPAREDIWWILTIRSGLKRFVRISYVILAVSTS